MAARRAPPSSSGCSPTAGFDTDTAVGGLTAFSLLEVGGLLALPIFALPAILGGVPVSRGLVHTALLGIAAFVLYAIFGVIVLRTDWPLATLGRVAQSLWNRITRGHRPPVASYWLPLRAGPPAYLLFRHRYGRPAPRRAAPGEADSTA